MNEKDNALDAIKDALKDPMAVEILYEAMTSLKNSPDLTISEAIANGFEEWSK